MKVKFLMKNIASSSLQLDTKQTQVSESSLINWTAMSFHSCFSACHLLPPHHTGCYPGETHCSGCWVLTGVLTQSWRFKLGEAELNSVVERSLGVTEAPISAYLTQQDSDHCLGFLLLVTPSAGASNSLTGPKRSKWPPAKRHWKSCPKQGHSYNLHVLGFHWLNPAIVRYIALG